MSEVGARLTMLHHAFEFGLMILPTFGNVQ